MWKMEQMVIKVGSVYIKENNMVVCKYWGEYDDDRGLYEWCKLVKKSCACCGTKKQCNFKWALEKDKENENSIR